MNELIFLAYIITISTASLCALRLGKEYLIGTICVMALLVNLFVMKQITLFGVTATASDALAVGITLSLNLMQEYYKKPAALQTIWVSFFCMLLSILLTQLHLAYLPALLDTSTIHYHMLFKTLPRILSASFVTYLIVQFTDAHLYSFLKERLHGRFFIMRNYGSLACTQLLDTVLFSFLGLYKLNESFSSLHTIGTIIAVSYTIKLLVIAIAVPYVKLAKTLYPPVSV